MSANCKTSVDVPTFKFAVVLPSGPTVYVLPAPNVDIVGAAKPLLTSSTPPVMFPFPSAAKVPATDKKPDLSSPTKENAYGCGLAGFTSEFKDAFENTIVTVEVPELPPEKALIVTVPLAGGESGAVYNPQVAPFVIEPGFPEVPFKFTCQMVPAHPAAVVNCKVAPAATAAAAGFTTTVLDEATTLIVIGTLAVEPETAWIVSVSWELGAVNRPLLEIVPVPLSTDHVAEVTADPE